MSEKIWGEMNERERKSYRKYPPNTSSGVRDTEKDLEAPIDITSLSRDRHTENQRRGVG